MSFARFGEDSNVYVYAGGKGYECCGCWVTLKTQSFETAIEIIHHLQTHLDAGHKVPGYTFYEIGLYAQQEHIIELLKTNFINNELLDLLDHQVKELKEAIEQTINIEATKARLDVQEIIRGGLEDKKEFEVIIKELLEWTGK